MYLETIGHCLPQVLKDRLTKTEEILTRAQSIVQSNKFLHEM